MGFLLVLGIVSVLYLLNCIVILASNERGIIVDRGTMRTDAVGPGLVWVFRPFQRIVKVLVNSQTLEIPVDTNLQPLAVRIRFRVTDPYQALNIGDDYALALAQNVQAFLPALDWRSDPESNAARLEKSLAGQISSFGLSLEGVEVGKPS